MDLAHVSEEHMTQFVKLGLLKVRDVHSFWLSLPGINHFAMNLNSGREEVSPAYCYLPQEGYYSRIDRHRFSRVSCGFTKGAIVLMPLGMIRSRIDLPGGVATLDFLRLLTYLLPVAILLTPLTQSTGRYCSRSGGRSSRSCRSRC